MSHFERGYVKNSLSLLSGDNYKTKKTLRFRGLDIQGSWNAKQNPQHWGFDIKAAMWERRFLSLKHLKKKQNWKIKN